MSALIDSLERLTISFGIDYKVLYLEEKYLLQSVYMTNFLLHIIVCNVKSHFSTEDIKRAHTSKYTRALFAWCNEKKIQLRGMREMHSPNPIIRSRVNSRNSCRRRVTIAVVCALHPC